ncbi:semaphorin-7A-like [Microcaecilia unicolor]|uniref:Semaphorin-1A n=1 Tax=Microcaecilia unicolor TaxID=1415580 RepID=A0A6P7WHH6_9AMPH|nr:semaphorin-7A-like [Microcaecilia unicolor]
METAFFLLSALALVSSQKIPRLKLLRTDYPGLKFERAENHSVLFHDEGCTKAYIGGRGVVYLLTISDSSVSHHKILFNVDEKASKTCKARYPAAQDDCDNYIRVIQRINSTTIIICGTNAESPKCWFLNKESKVLQSNLGQPVSGDRIAPALPSQPAVTMAIEGEMYSALSQDRSVFQRSYGQKKLVKTEEKWLGRAEFISMALLPEKDKSIEEIYVFYNEVNRTIELDKEPIKARLGRVCKVDEGGKNFLVDFWTTFLKARLICGNPSDFQYFNKLKDTFVLAGDSESRGTMFGIFTNIWGSTAVCAYSMDRIKHVFATSKLKGYQNPLTGSRPGKCVPQATTNALPRNVLTVIKDHPEIEENIYPEGNHPLYVLPPDQTYTRVIADRVWDFSNNPHTVLFLGTDKGKIHKVLYSKGQAGILAELSPFFKAAPVSTMALDSSPGHLYVGTTFEVIRMPLADCEQYGDTCRKCVLARDPYCGWDSTNRRCSAISQGGNDTNSNLPQNLDPQNLTVCEKPAARLSQENVKVVSVDRAGYIYLPCPVRSQHASYTWWRDGSNQYPCIVEGDSCVLRFNKDTPMHDGVFRCSTTEDGVEEEITAYKLVVHSSSGIPRLFLPAVAATFLLVITFVCM